MTDSAHATPVAKLFLIQTDDSTTSSYRRWRSSYSTFPSIDRFVNDLTAHLTPTDNGKPGKYSSIEVYDGSLSVFVPLVDDISLCDILSSPKPTQLLLKSAADKDTSEIPQIRGRAFDTSSGLTLSSIERGEKTILMAEPGTAHLGTGLNTWDGSIVLAKYLEQHQTQILKGKRVLELGAGTGIAGMAAAWLGAKHTVVTDLPYVLENLQNNVQKNFATESHDNLIGIEAKQLDWKDPATYPIHDGESWDTVIGADIVWVESLVPSLVQALSSCANEDTTVLISHQTRSIHSDNLLFRLLNEHFDYKIISEKDLHPDFSVPQIFIIHATRKSTTLK